MVQTWNAIAKTPEYKKLTPDDKEFARNKYFSEIIQPTLLESDPFTDLSSAKQEFDSLSLPSAGEYQKDRALRGAGNIMNMSGTSYIYDALTPEKKETDYARMLGYQGLQAPNRGQRMLGGVTEFATEGVMTAPMLAIGNYGLGAKTALSIEGLSTVLGGLGSEYGGEIGAGLGKRTWGEAVGSLLGIGTGTVVGGGSRAIRKGASGFTDRKKIWDRMTNERIGGILKSDKKYVDNIIEADTVAKKLQLNPVGPPKKGEALDQSGFNLAQASDSPGIKSLFEIYERGSPSSVEEIVGQQKSLEKGLSSAEQRAFPATGESVRGVIDRSLIKTQEEQGLLALQFNRKDPQKIGSDLKKIRDARANEVKASIGAGYDSLYKKADAEGLEVDMSDVGGRVTKIFGDDANTFQNPDMPSALTRIYNKYIKKQDDAPKLPKATNMRIFEENQKILAEYEQTKGKTSFAELHSLWKLVNRQLGVFSLRGDDNAVRALSEVKDALKSQLDVIEKSGSSIGNQFKELNARYSTEYAQIYKKGTGGKLARFNKYGDTTPDEQVVSSLFFKPDNTSSLDDFVKIYGDDPDAMNLLRNGALDIFGKKTIDKTTGLIDQNKANKFLKDYELVLDKLPGLKKELTDVSSRNAAMIERNSFYQELIKINDKDNLSNIFKNDDIDRLMSFLTTDNNAMIRLSKEAIANNAGPQFARSLARHLAERPDGFAYLFANEKTIRPIMERISKGHFENLKTIVKGWEIANRVVPRIGSKAEQVIDPLKKATGSSMDSVFSQYRAATQGRTSFKQMGATISAKWLTKFGFDSMMQATKVALFDPNVAHTLARITRDGPLATPDKSIAVALKKHMATAGIRSQSQLTEPESLTGKKRDIMADQVISDYPVSDIRNLVTP